MTNEEEKNIMAGCLHCGGKISVRTIYCKKCAIKTDLPDENNFLPRIATLPQRDIHFIQLFLELDGNIKALSEALNLSVPTVKNRLENVKKFLREF